MSKQITSFIIVALISFALGFFIAPIISGTTTQDTFQDGWDAAKQRLAETGYMPIMEGMEITSVSGEVKDIQGNKISLSIHPLEPLANPELDNRVIETDANTKVYRLTEKNMAQYQEEMEEFNEKIAEQAETPEAVIEPIMPPEPFVKEEISFSALEIGARISVLAQENIKDVKEFKAVEIIIQFTPRLELSEPVVPGSADDSSL